MPKSTKTRKRYRVRPCESMAGLALLVRKSHENAAADYFVPLTPDEQRDAAIIFGAAFAQIVNGRGEREHAQRLADMCNTALVLCERGFGKEYERACVEGLDNVFRMGLHYQKARVWMLDDVARAALSRVYDVYCAQLEVAGQGHLLDAELEVARRANEGNYYRDGNPGQRAEAVQPETTEALG
jgi:hypothetical protein